MLSSAHVLPQVRLGVLCRADVGVPGRRLVGDGRGDWALQAAPPPWALVRLGQALRQRAVAAGGVGVLLAVAAVGGLSGSGGRSPAAVAALLPAPATRVTGATDAAAADAAAAVRAVAAVAAPSGRPVAPREAGRVAGPPSADARALVSLPDGAQRAASRGGHTPSGDAAPPTRPLHAAEPLQAPAPHADAPIFPAPGQPPDVPLPLPVPGRFDGAAGVPADPTGPTTPQARAPAGDMGATGGAATATDATGPRLASPADRAVRTAMRRPRPRAGPPPEPPSQRADDAASAWGGNPGPAAARPGPPMPRREVLVAIPDAHTAVVPGSGGLPEAVRVGGRLPSGATLLRVDPRAGVADTDRGTLRLE